MKTEIEKKDYKKRKDKNKGDTNAKRRNRMKTEIDRGRRSFSDFLNSITYAPHFFSFFSFYNKSH